MDYGKSSEPDSTMTEDDWDDIELSEEDIESDEFPYEAPAPVTVAAQFKSGLTKEWTFTLPKTTEMYSVPVTREGMLELIASSYSVGESPYIILPLDDGTFVFLDLGATDFMELK